MSLLLEALKKAELAKQAAKEGGQAPSTPPLTRDQLPDISQAMDIRSEDLRIADPEPAPKRKEKLELELAPEEPLKRARTLELAPEEPPQRNAAVPPAAPAPARAAESEPSYSPAAESTYPAPGEAAERKQAQQMFDAKELDVNPRKPFYFTLAALGLFAVGAAGYIWWEMQPKTVYKLPPPSEKGAAPPVTSAPPPQAAPPAPADTPAAGTAVPPTATPAGEPATASPAPAPGPAAPAAQRPGATPAPGAVAPAPSVLQAPSPPLLATAPRSAGTARPGGPAASPASKPAESAAPPRRSEPRSGDITITPSRIQSDPVLEGAYQAFNAGDLQRARDDYQRVLRSSPDNRDALLGLAAVETQAKRHDQAEIYYLKLLELDPRDPHAQAGLIGLRGQTDTVATESRLKTMIAARPEASFLQFSLGNQYAAQGRWSEAQQAYFHAYSSDPENPDFAFNLAISLDRLRQTKPALDYYRRALELANTRPASFDKAQIGKRVAQLER